MNGAIEYVDTFMLTMAMTALGTETSIDKFKHAGAKPFVLAGLLYVWLVGAYPPIRLHRLHCRGCRERNPAAERPMPVGTVVLLEAIRFLR